MYILGLNLSHNCTACLLKDGEIIGCVSEERFVRKKNVSGFPKNAVAYLLKLTNISVDDLELVVNGGLSLTHEWNPTQDQQNPRKRWLFSVYFLMSLSPILDFIFRNLHYLLTKWPSKIEIYNLIRNNLNVKRSKIILAPHHDCHAYAAYFGTVSSDKRKNNYLVLTHDAEGDMLCASVWKAYGNKLTPIKQTPAGNSLAAIYGIITALLGMTINEHEYKIMGLAPYASDYDINKVYPIIRDLIQVDRLIFKGKLGMRATFMYLQRKLLGKRFDGIAGAIQKFTEDKVRKWVNNAVLETNIHKITLGGGLFMNIKANKILSELPSIKDISVCPSSGDESNAIGAAYFGYEVYCRNNGIQFNPLELKNLYLGPQFLRPEIERIIRRKEFKNKFTVKKFDNINKEVAKLLSKGKIVARFSGRMEWGARALGNRSILADPRNSEEIRIINEQIKNRDFWMPFACTVLDRVVKKYIVNPKSIEAPFMVMGFDTTEEGRNTLKAGIHPYDFSIRPQVLRKKVNPGYYNLIEEFEKLTGVGALLNTSFNLHGDPVVCSPEDATYTFLNSGLKYLALENYLLTKN